MRLENIEMAGGGFTKVTYSVLSWNWRRLRIERVKRAAIGSGPLWRQWPSKSELSSGVVRWLNEEWIKWEMQRQIDEDTSHQGASPLSPAIKH